MQPQRKTTVRECPDARVEGATLAAAASASSAGTAAGVADLGEQGRRPDGPTRGWLVNTPASACGQRACDVVLQDGDGAPPCSMAPLPGLPSIDTHDEALTEELGSSEIFRRLSELQQGHRVEAAASEGRIVERVK